MTEMEAFATVVEKGGFTNAARRLGLSKTAVSKHVAALEGRLGTQLLNRTTRRVSPTEIGLIYYDRVRRLLNEAGEADALIAAMQCSPAGRLRVCVSTDLGVSQVSPRIGAFLMAYPDLALDLVLRSREVDLASEDFDLMVRVGEPPADGNTVTRLTDTALRMVASPAYLQRHGRPRRIDDLNDHRLLHSSHSSAGAVWRLTAPSGERREIRAQGTLTVNDGQSLLNACVSGLGIAYLPAFLYAGALRSLAVEPVLPDLVPEVQPIFAVALPGKSAQPKVRALVEFLAGTVFADRGGERW